MDQQSFEILLQRYIDGYCTEDEILRVQHWFTQIESKTSSGLSETEKSLVENRLLKNIEYRIAPEVVNRKQTSPRSHFQKTYIFYAGLAATLLLATLWILRDDKVAGKVFSDNKSISLNQSHENIYYKNSSQSNKLLALEDKSTVLLAPGSSIQYKTHFEKSKREVHLKGNAFFEVTKNAKRPFIVYCGATVTKVIGTSFWIKTFKGSKSIEVAVKTGKVSVSEAVSSENIQDGLITYKNTIFLSPNQRVIFFPEKRKMNVTLVETPLLLDSLTTKPNRFIYNDSPLSEVLEELSAGYGVEILTSNEKLKTCSFTGDLSEMNFDQKFEIVCESIGTRYTKQGTSILLTGEGCR